MAHVTVTVNGRNYRLGCLAGEESRVLQLAAEVDAQARALKGGIKSVPEDRLFLMAAIVMADQLTDAREELQRVLKQMAEFRAYQVIDGGNYIATRDLARIGEAAAVRLEALANRTGVTVG
jgi:cell division protein ZapA